MVKVGLIRHFKVKLALPDKVFLSRDEFIEWLEEYEQAGVEQSTIDLCNIAWRRCYSSDMSRALKTAGHIHDGTIITHRGLRELNPLLSFKRNYTLPLFLWAIAPRIKQLCSHDLNASYGKQISTCLDEILSASDEDTLIVSHGFAMMFLQKELKRRGFTGGGFLHPENGRLYVYERC